jgi:hypothetical protein
MAYVNGVCLSCGQDGRTALELLSNAADAARLQVHCSLTTHKFFLTEMQALAAAIQAVPK